MHTLTDQDECWIANKKQIWKNHTMHHNNTIKNIHNKFKGMNPVSFCCVNETILTKCFVKEIMLNPQKADLFLDLDQVLKLRRNATFYINFLDLFAHCIVPVQSWKQFRVEFGVSGSPELFNNIFTISDEAFLLVVLLSNETKWKSEMVLSDKHAKVSFSFHCMLKW